MKNTCFLDACLGNPHDRLPIWLMRQAGRYLPEYRAMRLDHRMLELCQDPALVTEVTLQPLRRFDLDAAILFSDITIPFLSMNVAFDIVAGVGPVIENPISSRAAIDALVQEGFEERLAFVPEAVRLLRRELSIPLIGFAGAPFTLATYLVEGKPSRDHRKARELIYSDRQSWNALMDTLAAITIRYCRMQVAAGAQAIQLFDSWVGSLPADLFESAVLPWLKQIVAGMQDLKVPLIYFSTNSYHLLPLIRGLGVHVIGVDALVPLRTLVTGALQGCVLQGNLDPACLFGDLIDVTKRAREIVSAGKLAPGHIFNLGHGVLPQTSPDAVSHLINAVREATVGTAIVGNASA